MPYNEKDLALAKEIEQTPFWEKWKKLEELLEPFGFGYDAREDIFYSILEGWQRKFGYCRAYDEGASHFSIIFDCEPFFFLYGEKEWLLEFWKGQYGMTSGGEVGLYWRDIDDVIPVSLRIYDAVPDYEMPMIFIRVIKKGKELFHQKGRHWWMAGFVLGEYSKPKHLAMETELVFKNDEMAIAVLEAIEKRGYTKEQVLRNGNRILFFFDKPKSRQPFWQSGIFTWPKQLRNRYFCYKYRRITKVLDSHLDKILYLEKKAPKLFQRLLKIGGNRGL